MSGDPSELIDVCAACLTAICWHGEIMCDEAKEASTTKRKRSYLDKMKREHQGNYSREKLDRVCGVVK